MDRSNLTGSDDAKRDDRLVRAAVAGDRRAFAEFYERNIDVVIAFFYRRTACPHTAADLAAETFARTMTSLHRFDPRAGTARSWLFGIANNLFLQWMRTGRAVKRARGRLQIVTPTLTEDDLQRIEQSVDWAPMQEALTVAMAELSDPLRQAVVLRVVDDLPYDDVAARLGCSVGAARVRVSRALASLTASLEGTA